MNLKSNNKVETNKYVLEIEVNAEDFEAAVQKAFLKARNKISIPGFRKGKAPRKMIEKLYGEETFFEDAANDLVPVETIKALEEAKLEIVTRPEIEVVSLEKGTGMLFKATCIVKPEVEISDYKGIEIKKVVNDVTDKDVDDQIDKIREKNARLITVEDRPAQDGDETNIDFKGFIDDVAFEGGEAQGFALTLGSGQFIPGFEEQIVGHNIDDEFDVNVSFPEDYQMEEIAGKPAVFKVKLNEIKTKELPETDDDFVKDATEFESLNDLKNDIKTKLIENSKKKADQDVENKLFETVINNTKAEVPQVMFDMRIDEMVKDFAQRLSMQGINMDMYLQYTGMTSESFRKTFEDRAKNEVMLRLAFEQIVKDEKIEVNDDEIEAEFKKIADDNNVAIEKVKELVATEDLKLDIQVSKAAEIVKNSAKISE